MTDRAPPEGTAFGQTRRGAAVDCQAGETVLESDGSAESCALRLRFPSAELTALLPAGARRTLDGPGPRVRRRGAPRRDAVAAEDWHGTRGRRRIAALAFAFAALIALVALVVPGRWGAARSSRVAVGPPAGSEPAAARSPPRTPADARGPAPLLAPVPAADARHADARHADPLDIRRAMRRGARAQAGEGARGPTERMPAAAAVR